MSEGSQTRRTFRGFAWMVSPMILALGCQQLPVPRPGIHPLTASPEPSKPNDNSPETSPSAQASPDGVALPRLPPVPGSENRPSTEVPRSLTPILDEALIESVGLHQLEPTIHEERELSEAPLAKSADPKPPAPESDDGAPAKDAAKPVATPKAVSSESSKPIDPEKTVVPLNPRVIWREGIERLRTLAHERSSLEPDSSEIWTDRARLLDTLALTDTDERTDHPLWKTVLVALATDPRAASAGTPRSARLREAVVTLEDRAPLAINDLRLCSKVIGFGNYVPLDASSCKAGQALIVYCEVDGLLSITAGETARSRLAGRVEVISSQAGEPVWSQTLGTAEDVCRHRRRDFFVNYRVTLPDSLPPGPYELRLTEHDELADRSASSTIPLTIRP